MKTIAIQEVRAAKDFLKKRNSTIDPIEFLKICKDNNCGFRATYEEINNDRQESQE